MIVLPKKRHPHYGLHRAANETWVVRWSDNGKTVTKSTGTKDAAESIRVRDQIYKQLRAEKGAVHVGDPRHLRSGRRYIYWRPPYTVKIPGNKAVTAQTLPEAIEIRNAALDRQVKAS